MAASLIGEDRGGRFVVTCDHASNAVPDWVSGGDLGVDPADMQRHIAWDVGAAGLAMELAEALGAPAVLSTFSRLVIDPNRGEDDPTLVMRLYDGTIIPANARLTEAEVDLRMARLYRPYHAALARVLGARADAVVVAVHSFTPCLRGRAPRPWQVGVLHSHRDSRLSQALIDELRADGDLTVGDNEPYSGHLPGDSVDRHALANGRHNTLIEVRNDLLADRAGQQAWAERLARALRQALDRAG
jgi:predicted N-formylglutamate amidohydrolase